MAARLGAVPRRHRPAHTQQSAPPSRCPAAAQPVRNPSYLAVAPRCAAHQLLEADACFVLRQPLVAYDQVKQIPTAALARDWQQEVSTSGTAW